MNPNTTQYLKAIFHPILILLFLIRRLPLSLLYRLRVVIDGVDRPYYAYSLLHAADLARSLKIKSISAFEFGVAGGTGLVLLEKHAEIITKLTGVKIEIYGFDIEKGMPEPADYRDVPFVWQKGFYKMDKKLLQGKLKKSTKLILGDVKTTLPKFLKTQFAPIGFIAFDMDYYTPTKVAFKMFDIPSSKRLPRVFCYFDDVIGNEEEILCEYIGEPLAIKEFNAEHPTKKLSLINGLAYKRVFTAAWNKMIYVMHDFKHPQYNTYVYLLHDRQIKL
jgi:hypothetical protein